MRKLKITKSMKADNIRIRESFATIKYTQNRDLINIYGENNKQLDCGDLCFFLVYSITQYHTPIICKGMVLKSFYDEFCKNTQSKHYYIVPTGVIDDPDFVKKVTSSRQYKLFKIRRNKDNSISDCNYAYSDIFEGSEFNYVNENIDNNYFNNNNINYNALDVDCFFVRGYRTKDKIHYQEQLKNIVQLRLDWVEYMKEEYLSCISDIDEIINIHQSTKFNQICTASQD